MMRMVNRVIRPHPVPALVTQSMTSMPPESDITCCVNPAWLAAHSTDRRPDDVEGMPVIDLFKDAGMNYLETGALRASRDGGTCTCRPLDGVIMYSTRLPPIGIEPHTSLVISTLHPDEGDDAAVREAHRQHYTLEHVLRLAFAATAVNENLLMAERMLLELSRQQQNLIETIIERADFIAAETATDAGLLLEAQALMLDRSRRRA